MRVLFLTHRLPYAPNRGDRIRAYHITHEIARRHDVDLLALTHDDEEESHAGDLRGVVSRLRTARVPRLRNLTRGLCALPTSRPLTHALLDAPRMQSALAELVATGRPDVVLAYCSGMARFALTAPLDRIPAVVDMMDVDSEKWRELAARTSPPRRWIYGRERRVLGRFEAVAANHARATLVVNEREQVSLARLAPHARVHVVPNGIDVAAFHPDPEPSADPTVVFCGVMNYAPNEQAAVWLATEVWPLVRRHRPDARLVLVGATPSRAVQALAARDASVEVTGTVPDVRPYLRRAAVAAAPLAIARGIQNKVLEAIACGVPAVVTNAVFAGLPREVHAACRIADSPAAFASAILDLLSGSPASRRALSERAELGSLTWSTRLAPLVGILEDACR